MIALDLENRVNIKREIVMIKSYIICQLGRFGRVRVRIEYGFGSISNYRSSWVEL